MRVLLLSKKHDTHINNRPAPDCQWTCKEDLGYFLRVMNFAEMMTPDAEFDGQAKSGVKNEK